MRIAIHQMMSVDRSVAENIAHMEQACVDAKTGGADLIIFPEMAQDAGSAGYMPIDI